ncbi:D-alanyl-D-alanine carboxypeptidase/D-alanyl-D-alanine-endopeptidase [Sandarakinorhabdus sp.]|uniref:D-alanyl-D-alanine carboxypeptidase/D-alanyl-D-alanine endopeptidase n=1 Tax=Sandarakinorhabdus sp. TaxID=1916663 RepID=UPI00333ED5CE
MRLALIFALLAPTGMVAAQPAPPLQPVVEAILAQGPAGTRYGVMVTTLEGESLLAINPDGRFIPASNTKLFVTAAAFSNLSALEAAATGTGVRLEPAGPGVVDVVLQGRGESQLSSAPDCTTACLQTLADAVAANTRRVRHVVGDDSWFPAERWGPGMSWNNIQTDSGTGISALTLDDNEIAATVTPGAIGSTPVVATSAYYRIDNRLLTVAGDGEAIVDERAPNSDVVRLTGTIGVAAKPATLRFGVDDPADHAAWRLRELLRARGVVVSGGIATRHRPLMPYDDPAIRGSAPPPRPPLPDMLASLPAPDLVTDLKIINKKSQNLYSDLMLRRMARLAGSGSIADGMAALRAMTGAAGLPADSFTFADGSGMSSYNRITPRAATRLLIWAAQQPWGQAWRDTLPIAGVDGTLRNRFKTSSLQGKLLAKTGSLNATRALSGYLVTKSGRTLAFSAIANDMPDGADARATAVVDKALVAIAEAL